MKTRQKALEDLFECQGLLAGPEERPAALTIIESRRGAPSKHFELDPENGELRSATRANLIDGEARTFRCFDLRDLKYLLEVLEPHQALMFGVSAHDRVRVVAENALPGNPGAVARTKAHFRWPEGAGVLMLDYDHREGVPLATPCKFDAVLRKALPWWGDADRLYRYSSSSGIIRRKDRMELRPLRNFRCYMLVSDRASIPTIGAAIHQALWAAGYGRIEVGRAGQFLDRSLIDTAVWSPERLDFAGGASLGPGLSQDRPAPELVPGTARILAAGGKGALLSLSEWRCGDPRYLEARRALEPERKRRIAERVGEETAAAVGRGEDEVAARRRYERLYERRELAPDFVLTLDDGTRVTVGEVLRNKDRYHGRRCADPLEPGYRGDERVGYLNLRGSPVPHVWSHAHGGAYYRLLH